jgi:hypothetical protein
MSKKSPIVLCTFSSASLQYVEALEWGLGQIGYEAEIAHGFVNPTALNILFHGVGLDPARLTDLAPRCVYSNLEQIGGKPRIHIGPTAFKMMREFPTWDYSTENVRRLRLAGVADACRVPIGYAPLMEYIEPSEKDIDVLFYGSINDRRIEQLRRIESTGLRTVWNPHAEIWPDALRDSLIARSKIVLNLAYYDSVHVLEEIRICHLLANRVMVISEISPLTSMEEDLRAVIVGGELAELPAICASYCADDSARAAAAAAGYQTFRNRDWLTGLANAMAHVEQVYPILTQVKQTNVQPPRKINLGSGDKWRYDFINIDISDAVGADIVHDLSLPIPVDKTWRTWRFGEIRLGPECADLILAEHVFEQVKDLVACMTSCLEWLSTGGVMDILVRYDLSAHAWSEPTAVRAFTEQSWNAFCDRSWSVGWREECFDLVSQVQILSQLGQQLLENGLSQEALFRTPRAVEGLRVILRKRALTDAERAQLPYYFRNDA